MKTLHPHSKLSSMPMGVSIENLAHAISSNENLASHLVDCTNVTSLHETTLIGAQLIVGKEQKKSAYFFSVKIIFFTIDTL